MDGYVRTATDADALEVRRILDAAMLEPGDVEERIAEGRVLVGCDGRGGRSGSGNESRSETGTGTDEGGEPDRATSSGSSNNSDSNSGRNSNSTHNSNDTSDNDGERILGTIVLESREDVCGAHVAAIGVRRRHRGRGIGRTLMERALEREGRLTARFDDGVRPFYETLGFAIEPVDGERYRGVVSAADRDGAGRDGIGRDGPGS